MTAVLPASLPVPPAEPATTTPAGPRLGRYRAYAPRVVLGVLLLMTATVRLINLTGAPQRIDDEGTYVAQAYALLRDGDLAHYTYWYDHPPLGWIQLAGWLLLTGGPGSASNAVAAGRGFMVVVAVVTAALIWTLGRRLGMSVPATAAAVVLFALSPLAVQLGRTVYLDNIATAWLLAALVLFCSPQQRLAAGFGGAGCYGVAVLSKETMLLLLPAVLMLAWSRGAPATRRYAVAIIGTVLGLMLAGYALMAAVRGELVPGPGHVSLIEAVQYQLYSRAAGGSVFDPGAVNGLTVRGWLSLDPVLLGAALPVAVTALAFRHLSAVAVGVLLLAAILLRGGYLPIPFVIAVVPLVVLLVAGVPDAVVRSARARVGWELSRLRPVIMGVGVAATAALVASAAMSWPPVLRYLLAEDRDAPLRQAEQWISDNVPARDRLIVDDALWVDLVAEGRDRRDVVWFYKLETDGEVQAWSPRGWRDYDWVVSSAALRSGTGTTGQLADAVAASVPVAVFGAGNERVELLRIDAVAAGPAEGAGTAAAGALLADRLADSAEPEALAILRSGRLDPRALTVLGALSTREQVLLTGLPAVPGEEAAGQPRRQLQLAAAGPWQERIEGFFRAQTGAYAAESVERVPGGLLVRFPAGTSPVELPPPHEEAGPAARLRVADLRGDSGPEVLEVIGPDGRLLGSLGSGGYGTANGYRSLPPGTYTLASRPAADASAPPVVRQAVQVLPGRSYTFTLFTGAAEGSVTTQFAPDDPAPAPREHAQVRLVEGARETGRVTLTMDAPGGGGEIVLVDGVDYGLVTGYAQVPAGKQNIRVRSADREWLLPVQVPPGGAITLLLTDSAGGPALRSIPDHPGPAPALDPPSR